MSDDTLLWKSDEAGACRWITHAADDSGAALRWDPEAGALRFDFNLVGPASWVIARLPVAITLPSHYAVLLRLRGDMQANELQLKLVDPGTSNVWWWRRPGFLAKAQSETLTLRKASLEFAWGPRSGAEPDDIGAIELALSAEKGGMGTLWIEEIHVQPRDPRMARPEIVAVSASTSMPGFEAEDLLSDETTWKPGGEDMAPWIQLDLGCHSEHGGVVIDFCGKAFDAPATHLLASDDGNRWETLAQLPSSPRPRVWLRTTEGEGRYLRVELRSKEPVEIDTVKVVGLEMAVAPGRYAMDQALRARRGLYPRHLMGEQGYWAVVGGDGEIHKGLLGEDGALEVGAEQFTIEPFLRTEDGLVTWADAEITQSLEDDCLPIPSVRWVAGDLTMDVTAFANGPQSQTTLIARYQIENTGAAPRRLRLLLAIRPFQVNPRWQSLNMVGGVAAISRIELLGRIVHVNERREVICVNAADDFGAAYTEEHCAEYASGHLPPRDHVDDPLGFAGGTLAYDVELEPGGRDVIVIAVPQYESSVLPPSGLDRKQAAAWAQARLEETSEYWRRRLSVMPLSLPPCGDAFLHSVRASLAWVLVNREGPRIQPGPRCYRRSWIRDGTLTGAALAEMGFTAELPAFLRWYAPHQLEDGRVPCAVDRRGVDLVHEHDSHGQLIWGIVECYRLSGDEGLLREMWPHVKRAAAAIAALRAQRMTPPFAGKAAYGLVPESISHEGYSSRPVHAYWDDFFALRGLADAAFAATVLGDKEASASIDALLRAMQTDVRASIARVIGDNDIDFIPGSVELADPDPTSTAIAFDPCRQHALLPAAALERTFELFWEQLQHRVMGRADLDAYSAYEARNAFALIMLGKKGRALDVLAGLIEDQRPTSWRQWPEVSTIDPRLPRFLGDLPHGWVASGFVRAVRRLFAYEHDQDDALVIGAGLAPQWVREAPGVRVRGMPTYYGPLDYGMVADGDGRVRVTLGSGFRWPEGGVVIESALAEPLRHVEIAGDRVTAPEPHRFTLRRHAAEIVLKY